MKQIAAAVLAALAQKLDVDEVLKLAHAAVQMKQIMSAKGWWIRFGRLFDLVDQHFNGTETAVIDGKSMVVANRKKKVEPMYIAIALFVIIRTTRKLKDAFQNGTQYAY